MKIKHFESISESLENKLVGGFSVSFSGIGDNLENISNNCKGGNCSPGCGVGGNNCMVGGNGCPTCGDQQ